MKGFLGALLLLGFIIVYWKIVVAVVVLVVVVRFGPGWWASWQQHRDQNAVREAAVRAARARQDAQTAARADQQDAWYLAGDPRGIYGAGHAA